MERHLSSICWALQWGKRPGRLEVPASIGSIGGCTRPEVGLEARVGCVALFGGGGLVVGSVVGQPNKNARTTFTLAHFRLRSSSHAYLARAVLDSAPRLSITHRKHRRRLRHHHPRLLPRPRRRQAVEFSPARSCHP